TLYHLSGMVGYCDDLAICHGRVAFCSAVVRLSLPMAQERRGVFAVGASVQPNRRSHTARMGVGIYHPKSHGRAGVIVKRSIKRGLEMWGFRWGMFKTFGIENEKYEEGLDYDERQVRLNVVHARQDIAGLCHMAHWALDLLALLNVILATHVIHHW